jgi:hypothetical protein
MVPPIGFGGLTERWHVAKPDRAFRKIVELAGVPVPAIAYWAIASNTKSCSHEKQDGSNLHRARALGSSHAR